MTSTCDFEMEAFEGFDPWIPREMPDCTALLSSTFVAPVLNTTHWIPLLTTSCIRPQCVFMPCAAGA